MHCSYESRMESADHHVTALTARFLKYNSRSNTNLNIATVGKMINMENMFIKIAVLIFLIISNTYADTIIIDCEGGGDFLTIQEGVNSATEGDTILVSPCIYPTLFIPHLKSH